MSLLNDLNSAGFSLAAALPTDAAIALAPALAVPLAAAPSALLIGNTRDLWPRFVAAYRADASLRSARDPFDTFVETALTAVLEQRAVRFAHRTYDQAYVPMQRLAEAARLGVLSATHLVIHRRYGPWFSLRAIVAYEGPADALVEGFAGCDARECRRRCQPLFDHAMTGSPTWRDWLAVRAACSGGTDWRFSDEQIIYHYTKDRRVIGTGMTLADYSLCENTAAFEG
ncbi:MAG: hypothetical protein KBG15_10785 [Kofleriaceae bacterium]|nr:hypothetical protein [Kofleriaceae bacterium]